MFCPLFIKYLLTEEIENVSTFTVAKNYRIQNYSLHFRQILKEQTDLRQNNYKRHLLLFYMFTFCEKLS